ncbi:hypothetical protein OH76DRAFT_796805 [Lentinus brumalis]|uniref:Uncharacterized protein n=1 Tax=Lentinus brumalis TaxID=2498619 RepID=A0A371D3N5_9APHY|nr:hypothetical protein OH76DRAFT_796805 [Polyporus brumalis]
MSNVWSSRIWIPGPSALNLPASGPKLSHLWQVDQSQLIRTFIRLRPVLAVPALLVAVWRGEHCLLLRLRV